MKTFQIMRTDHTVILTVVTPPGISPPHPKNPVAEGVIFKSGKVVINWLGDVTSVVVHDNIENVIKIHCNGDSSLIQYGHDSNQVCVITGQVVSQSYTEESIGNIKPDWNMKAILC